MKRSIQFRIRQKHLFRDNYIISIPLFSYTFFQGEPIPPSYIYVVCKSTTAIVILKPIVNGIEPQELYIQYTIEGHDMASIKINTNDTNHHIEHTITGLYPGRNYTFSILASNAFREKRSKPVNCVTDTCKLKFLILTKYVCIAN